MKSTVLLPMLLVMTATACATTEAPRVKALDDGSFELTCGHREMTQRQCEKLAAKSCGGSFRLVDNSEPATVKVSTTTSGIGALKRRLVYICTEEDWGKAEI